MSTAKKKATLEVAGVGTAGQYQDVYYSKEVKRNLVGVWNVAEKGYKLTFDEDSGTIVSKESIFKTNTFEKGG
jgi:hypothetical protein